MAVGARMQAHPVKTRPFGGTEPVCIKDGVSMAWRAVTELHLVTDKALVDYVELVGRQQEAEEERDMECVPKARETLEELRQGQESMVREGQALGRAVMQLRELSGLRAREMVEQIETLAESVIAGHCWTEADWADFGLGIPRQVSFAGAARTDSEMLRSRCRRHLEPVLNIARNHINTTFYTTNVARHHAVTFQNHLNRIYDSIDDARSRLELRSADLSHAAAFEAYTYAYWEHRALSFWRRTQPRHAADALRDTDSLYAWFDAHYYRPVADLAGTVWASSDTTIRALDAYLVQLRTHYLAITGGASLGTSHPPSQEAVFLVDNACVQLLGVLLGPPGTCHAR
ncbi:hypothetical protein IWX49DRAFT_643460 [Phyllosticta citricarpa]